MAEPTKELFKFAFFSKFEENMAQRKFLVVKF